VTATDCALSTRKIDDGVRWPAAAVTVHGDRWARSVTTTAGDDRWRRAATGTSGRDRRPRSGMETSDVDRWSNRVLAIIVGGKVPTTCTADGDCPMT